MKHRLRTSGVFGGERGEALVEFAILAPIILVLLLAMIDFGRVFDAWVVTTNAAREGARYAAIYAANSGYSDSQVAQMSSQKAYDYLVGGLGGRPDVTYGMQDINVVVPSTRSQQPVTVNVAVRVQIWALLNIFLSDRTTVHASATLRI